MADLVFSESWVRAWAQELADSPTYREAAHTWEGSILLEVPADGASSWRAVYLDLWHGDCREAKVAVEADREQADFVLSAPLSHWRRVLDGDLEPILAIMSGKLRLSKGSVAKLTPYIAASKELVAAAGRLDSTFPD